MKEKREKDKRGIVLCGSLRLLFALVATATTGERADKLTRWLETEKKQSVRLCVCVCVCVCVCASKAVPVVSTPFWSLW